MVSHRKKATIELVAAIIWSIFAALVIIIILIVALIGTGSG